MVAEEGSRREYGRAATRSLRLAARPSNLMRRVAEKEASSAQKNGFRKGERCERRQWRKQRAERINRNEKSSDSERATIEVADRMALRGVQRQSLW